MTHIPLPLDSRGNVEIAEQDQYSHTVGTLMAQGQGAPMTLASNTVVDSYTLTMSAGHSFLAGDELLIVEDDDSYNALVISVAGDVITLNAPLDRIYTTSAVVLEVLSNMNVNGSVTPQEFDVRIGATATISLDITGVRFVITDGAAMDDGKFGGIAALTRGIVLRLEHSGGTHNLFTARTNGKLGLVMDNQEYTDKAPAGENAMQCTWQIRNDLGVTLRLDPGDKIVLVVQDDLTALTTFKAWVYGHHVED